jgi:TetR/AcrR family transcriptional repressor of nem operon
VTEGASYHKFDSKEALGFAVVDELIAEIMREKWQLPLQDAQNAVDALVGIVRSSVLSYHNAWRCGDNALMNRAPVRGQLGT